MISLKRSAEAYELSRGFVDSLLGLLSAVRQYAVETDPAAVERFRANVGVIIQRIQSEPDQLQPALLESIPSDFRAVMRSYRDRAAAYIEQIRHDLTETSDGLYQLLSAIQTGAADAETRLRDHVHRLQSLDRCDSLDQLRKEVARLASGLNECVEQIRAEKDAVIAQLHAEIQTLHRSLDEAQRAATLDSLTGFLNRGEFERLLRRDLAIDAQVGVLHIVMPDLPALAAFHPAAVMRELVSSFSKRLTNAVPSGSQLGRWSEDVFCVEAAEPLLRSLSTTVATRCSGTYVCAADGRAVTIPMYPTVTVVRSTDAEGPDALVRKLDRIRHYIAKRMEPVTQP